MHCSRLMSVKRIIANSDRSSPHIWAARFMNGRLGSNNIRHLVLYLQFFNSFRCRGDSSGKGANLPGARSNVIVAYLEISVRDARAQHEQRRRPAAAVLVSEPRLLPQSVVHTVDINPQVIFFVHLRNSKCAWLCNPPCRKCPWIVFPARHSWTARQLLSSSLAFETGK
eukprot:363169-Chlamydomonas_euryale.AAC.44